MSNIQVYWLFHCRIWTGPEIILPYWHTGPRIFTCLFAKGGSIWAYIRENGKVKAPKKSLCPVIIFFGNLSSLEKVTAPSFSLADKVSAPSFFLWKQSQPLYFILLESTPVHLHIYPSKCLRPVIYFLWKNPSPVILFVLKSSSPVIFFPGKVVAPSFMNSLKLLAPLPPLKCPWCRPLNFGQSLKSLSSHTGLWQISNRDPNGFQRIFNQWHTGPCSIWNSNINGATVNFSTGHFSFPGPVFP